MTNFVLDCSIAMVWCFEDEANAKADALLERVRFEGAVVPALWHWEVANVLALAVRKHRLSQRDAQARLTLLGRLPIATDAEGPARAWNEAFALAQSQALTIYDSAYLELALRLGIGLATLDKRLRQAGQSLKITVLP